MLLYSFVIMFSQPLESVRRFPPDRRPVGQRWETTAVSLARLLGAGSGTAASPATTAASPAVPPLGDLSGWEQTAPGWTHPSQRWKKFSWDETAKSIMFSRRSLTLRHLKSCSTTSPQTTTTLTWPGAHFGQDKAMNTQQRISCQTWTSTLLAFHANLLRRVGCQPVLRILAAASGSIFSVPGSCTASRSGFRECGRAGVSA